MNLSQASHVTPTSFHTDDTHTIRTLWVLLALACCCSSGCSRAFWRNNADQEVYQAISERLNDPRWQLPRYDVAPDPESRFHDPYDPDCSPLPPDDPAAHTYMLCADGMKGSRSWHKIGQSFSIENPHWLQRYGLDPEMMNSMTGDYTGRMPTLKRLSLAECVELSQIHSRELQTQIEDLYLTALDVSFERFQFNVRYLGIGGGEPSASSFNTIVPHGPGDTYQLGGRFGVSRLLPAGGQIAAELTNNTLWLFSSSNQPSSTSILSFSMVQPLFAGAGRKVVMENLTQAERDLLYQARTLARFRQTLFTNVISDGQGSYLNLIQQIQVIRNQEQNIERLRNQVAILQSNASQKGSSVRADLDVMPEGLQIPESLGGKLQYNAARGLLVWLDNTMTAEEEQAVLAMSRDPVVPADSQLPIAVNELIQSIRVNPTPLDVLQLQGNLANSINQLRSQERSLQDGLDNFKFTLGLPPDMALTIDDSMLVPFEVIAPELRTLETEVTDFIEVWAAMNEANPSAEELLATNASLSDLVTKVEQEGFGLLDRDVEGLHGKMEKRLSNLDLEEDRARVEQDVERDLLLLEDARSRLNQLKREVAELDPQIRAPEPEPEPTPEGDSGVAQPPPPGLEEEESQLPPAQRHRREISKTLLGVHAKLLQIARSLVVVQIGLRVEQIEIPEFEMTQEQIVQTAVENRVDLMNQKGVVTDLRRKVEIAANQLLANVDVVMDADIRNSGGNKPLNFAGKNSQLRAGLQVTAPLDQIDERNSYRRSLISYQRARRDFMAFEDQVKQQVRRNWRQLTVLKRNLETSRLQLRLAARQYESAVDESTAPTPVGGGGGNRSGVQGTNLIQALNSVISAQNSLIQNWITYEQNRLGIYRDMGMMDIGPDGIWNDPHYRKLADQQTQDGSPARPILPDAGNNNGSNQTIPDLDNSDGLGLSLPGGRGPGGGREAEGVVVQLRKRR